MTDLKITEKDGGITFGLRVMPRASRLAILGVHDGALKVALTAPPVEGAANAALVKFLSKKLRVPKRAIEIVHGDHGRNKTLRITGVSAEELRVLVPQDQ
jgi:uncharacterized protein (TIGR00251 family)